MIPPDILHKCNCRWFNSVVDIGHFERLPFIDPQWPHLSQRHQRILAKRTVIERLHKLMKFDYGDSRLTKRGNVTFQARLDKTLFAMHIVLGTIP